jgi:hypothetical protein
VSVRLKIPAGNGFRLQRSAGVMVLNVTARAVTHASGEELMHTFTEAPGLLRAMLVRGVRDE